MPIFELCYKTGDYMKIFKLQKIASISVSYTGVVMNDSLMENGQIVPSKQLLSRFTIPQGWTHSANHMTMNIGRAKDASIPFLGQEATLNVVAVAQDENVMAVKVETDLPTSSSFPHITIALNSQAEAKPSMSNDLTNWSPIKPFSITGSVQEVKTDGFLFTEEDERKVEEEERKLIEQRQKLEKEKSQNSPTNIIKSRGLNREQAIEFLRTETKIPEQAWGNILKSVGF